MEPCIQPGMIVPHLEMATDALGAPTVAKEAYLASGRRSIVFLGRHKQKKVAIKQECFPDARRTEKEAKWLQLLNQYDIGPRFLHTQGHELVYEYVEGTPILDWLATQEKESILLVLHDLLRQCRTMDKLRITKEEMHRPLKHVLVDKRPVLIDFERCHESDTPKNVTQVGQFLQSAPMRHRLAEKGLHINTEKLRILLREYKQTYEESYFEEILQLLR